MQYKNMVGMVVDNMVIDGITRYYDGSTDKMESAFIIKGMGMAINCELFVKKYFA